MRWGGTRTPTRQQQQQQQRRTWLELVAAPVWAATTSTRGRARRGRAPVGTPVVRATAPDWRRGVTGVAPAVPRPGAPRRPVAVAVTIAVVARGRARRAPVAIAAACCATGLSAVGPVAGRERSGIGAKGEGSRPPVHALLGEELVLDVPGADALVVEVAPRPSTAAALGDLHRRGDACVPGTHTQCAVSLRTCLQVASPNSVTMEYSALICRPEYQRPCSVWRAFIASSSWKYFTYTLPARTGRGCEHKSGAAHARGALTQALTNEVITKVIKDNEVLDLAILGHLFKDILVKVFERVLDFALLVAGQLAATRHNVCHRVDVHVRQIDALAEEGLVVDSRTTITVSASADFVVEGAVHPAGAGSERRASKGGNQAASTESLYALVFFRAIHAAQAIRHVDTWGDSLSIATVLSRLSARKR